MLTANLRMISVKGSIEDAGYPNGVPNWGTYLGGCQN